MSTTFTKNTQIVNIAIVQKDWNVIVKTKIKYQSNKKYNMKKIELDFCYRNKTMDLYNLET